MRRLWPESSPTSFQPFDQTSHLMALSLSISESVMTEVTVPTWPVSMGALGASLLSCHLPKAIPRGPRQARAGPENGR